MVKNKARDPRSYRALFKSKRNVLTTVSVIISLALVVGTLARVRIFRREARSNALTIPANPVQVNPSKEYIYAGSRLLATEEPGQSVTTPTESVAWTHTVGVAVAGNNLTKSGSSANWDAGAVSTRAIASGDGYVEFTTAESNTHKMLGLSNGDENAGYGDIDFALYPQADGLLYVYEGGEQIGNFGKYVAGDRLRVAVEGGRVKYQQWRNGGWQLLKASDKPLKYPLLVDTSFHTPNSTIRDAVLAGTLQDAFPAEPPCSDTPANVALATNGAVASASSTYSSGYPASSVIDGSRTAANWVYGGGWNDGTNGAFPDWVRVDFSGSKIIGEIDVITLQDNYTAGITPTESETFSSWGITGFDVQYLNGTKWVTVPGGSITSNNKVWRKISFPPVTTNSIRVLVYAAAGSAFSRVVELEAYPPSCGGAGVTENVVWTNAVGVSVSGNNLTRSGTPDAWNAGAVSTRAIASGNGYVEFTVGDATTFKMCGLSNGDTDQNYLDIDFAIFAHANGYLFIYESGGSVKDPGRAYKAGDRLKVTVENGVVKYWHNDEWMWTSNQRAKYPLLVDTSLYNPGTTIKNVVISGTLQ